MKLDEFVAELVEDLTPLDFSDDPDTGDGRLSFYDVVSLAGYAVEELGLVVNKSFDVKGPRSTICISYGEY